MSIKKVFAPLFLLEKSVAETKMVQVFLYNKTNEEATRLSSSAYTESIRPRPFLEQVLIISRRFL